jgi:hypothetical protein
MTGMNWKTVRLELAPTTNFPRGSPSRAFLINVPTDGNGCIDRATIQREPARATVRRFWASEPDSFGSIGVTEDSWSLQLQRDEDDAATFLLEDRPLSLNARVNVRSDDGTFMSFRVASIRPLGQPALP